MGILKINATETTKPKAVATANHFCARMRLNATANTDHILINILIMTVVPQFIFLFIAGTAHKVYRSLCIKQKIQTAQAKTFLRGQQSFRNI
jgi:hypothetical protein